MVLNTVPDMLTRVWNSFLFGRYTFLYQASRGTWEANGLNDYMYLISYVLMSLAVLQFNKK